MAAALAAPLTFEEGSNVDVRGFNEPSGITYHPHRGTLFVVGDEGDLLEMTTTGEWVKHKRIREADFEGVTCASATGLLYVAVEGEERILEIEPDIRPAWRHKGQGPRLGRRCRR